MIGTIATAIVITLNMLKQNQYIGIQDEGYLVGFVWSGCFVLECHWKYEPFTISHATY